MYEEEESDLALMMEGVKLNHSHSLNIYAGHLSKW